MLGADGCVVESGRDGVGGRDLAVVILKHIGISALQDARSTTAETCGMLAERGTAASGFDPDEPHLAILEELVECADSVGTAADAGDDGRRQSAFLLQYLFFDFNTDAAMKVAHHGWVRMSSERAAEKIM